jgi:hypothetical protein
MSRRTEPAPTLDIARFIYSVRGHRVILDSDLAGIYGVETRALNQAVRRNPRRFPAEFLFQLTADEASDALRLRSQIVILKAGRGHQHKLRPLLEPPPQPPKPEIGFHLKEDAVPYRIKRK